MAGRARVLWVSAALAALAGHASAAPILDQTQSVRNSTTVVGQSSLDGSNLSRAQVFTVGVGGLLASLRLGIAGPAQNTGDVVLSIYRTTGGVPEPTAMASLVAPGEDFPIRAFEAAPFTTIDVSGLGILVVPGDQFAFGLEGTGIDEYWDVNFLLNSGYSGGELFVRDLNGSLPGLGSWTAPFRFTDLMFQTFVDPEVVTPEPVAPLLLTLGIAGVVSARRRRSR